MTCKSETEAQRLERIATQLLAGILAGGSRTSPDVISDSIWTAKELIKQLDALAIAE